MKEIIYTAIFVGLGILLITLFLVMFRPKKDTVPTSGDPVHYVPGVYSSVITLNSQDINVEVTVDSKKNHFRYPGSLKRSRYHHVSPDAAGHG